MNVVVSQMIVIFVKEIIIWKQRQFFIQAKVSFRTDNRHKLNFHMNSSYNSKTRYNTETIKISEHV